MEILYPQTCCFCGKVSREKVCHECVSKIEYIKEPRCKRCGKPVRYADQEFCEDCKRKKFHYEQGKNVWLHKGPVRWSIYQFKYHNRRIFGEFYAEEMYRLYGQKLKEWKIDVIIPIPLHKKRRRRRGYNQAEIIARNLGKLAQIPVESQALARIRNTTAQKELSDKERKANLQHAFQVTKYWKKVRRVLLIDDIYTTGSTIDEVAKVLRENGAEKIWFFTVSIGQGG